MEDVKYSKGDYRRLSDRLKAVEEMSEITVDDLQMLQNIRRSYMEVLSIVFNEMDKIIHRFDPESVCTCRIKRIESIISKLKRNNQTPINRIQDIAGCRCILSEERQLLKLYDFILKNENNFPFKIHNKHNYLSEPKESGYKSIHIIVSLKEDEKKKVEVQLRCLSHHNWATMVEITDILCGTKIKEYGEQSNPELFKFHLLLSKSSLSLEEINYIANVAIKYNYVRRLQKIFSENYLEVRKHWNINKLQRKHYFLLSRENNKPNFIGYSDFEAAEIEYFKRFQSDENIVLACLGRTNFAKISIAYSNYFLTFNHALIQVVKYISEAVKKSYDNNRILSFNKYSKALLDTIIFCNDSCLVEMESFRNDTYVKLSKRKYKEWSDSIKIFWGMYIYSIAETYAYITHKKKNILLDMIIKKRFKIITNGIETIKKQRS